MWPPARRWPERLPRPSKRFTWSWAARPRWSSSMKIVRHPGVGMVSLTGDVATGKEVARAAAQTLKKVHLELGGKAPVVVFDEDRPPSRSRDGLPDRGCGHRQGGGPSGCPDPQKGSPGVGRQGPGGRLR